MRKLRKRFLSVGLSLVISSAIFLAVGMQSLAYTETTGKVSQQNVKVRESASTTSTQVSSLNQGDTIEIVDEAKDDSGYTWYKIRVNNNEYGYVRSDLVEKSASSTTSSTTTNTTEANEAAASLPATTVTTTDSKSATITADSVNVREGAGTAYDSVGKVTSGDTVTVTGEASGTDGKTWYQVTFGSSNKQGFIRSDFLEVGEAAEAPAEGEAAAEGEGAPAEGETAAGGEGAPAEEGGDQGGSEVTSEAGDGTYSLVYLTEETGTGVWYLYDNVEGYRVKVNELIEAAKSSDEVGTLKKTNNTFKTILIILGVVVAILVVVIIILALKLRDSIYYEDEEEEFDRYSQRKRARDDEEEEERPRRRSAEERTVRPVREENAERSVRNQKVRREEEVEERPARNRRAAQEETADRPSRRNAEDRQVRNRRAAQEEKVERPSRRAQDAQENVPAKEAPKHRAKNFIGDDEDFEFEFLDLDDDK